MGSSFFYGYVILSICFLNMVFVRGVAGSFSVFYVALLDEFHWSHGTGATIVSVNSLIYGFTSPLIGWAFDRLGPRALMPIAGLLICAGLFLSGLSHSLWQLYLFYGILVGIGQGGLSFVSNNALISHWFVRRRATAIGLATIGQGFGTLAIVPLAQLMISNVGWRYAFMLLATLVLITIVPANALFQRRNPMEVGQLPDGETSPPVQHQSRHAKTTSFAREWTVFSALRSFPFWSLTVGHLALGTGLYIIYTHLVAHLVTQGFDKLFAALVFGLVGFMRTFGTLLWGFISDRLGRGRAYGIATLVVLAGVGSLVGLRADSPLWFVYATVVLYGIGYSAGSPTYGAVIADIFSGSRVGSIFGFLEISFGLGMALGAWLGGFFYDLTGSYRWPFALGLATFTTSYLAVQASLFWHYRESASVASQKVAT